MAFTIYPAIDMLDGKCVRLLQGDYDKQTIYGDSPLDMATNFVNQGAEWIHLVDLDGAKAGRRINDKHVLDIKKNLDVKVQIGGGIRSEEDIAYYLENGVDRVILGSIAMKDPAFTKKMLEKYGNRIVIGIDAKDGYVATEGWIETSDQKAETLGKLMAEYGAEVFIFTDIATDGTLRGPNFAAVAAFAEATGKEVISSGGVSSLEDIRILKTHAERGIGGVIIGKALYTNQFTVKEALEEVKAW